MRGRLAAAAQAAIAACVACAAQAQNAPVASAPLLLAQAPAAASSAPLRPQQRLEVLGTTPLPGLNEDLRQVPANVQRFSSRSIEQHQSGHLGDFFERVPSSVVTQSAQGNPYQPDVAFRGFTGSPVLGTPQGISVFVDGVRVNEPFGDVVNWDLIAQDAIESVQFVPGTQPVYGLNTLGGAIALRTKDGRDVEAPQARITAGAWGRRAALLEWGRAHGAWDGYVLVHDARDSGWAEHNPSQVRQVFAKAGWRGAHSEVELSWTGADNRLEATQTLPVSFLSTPRAAYTWPDVTRNLLNQVTLHAVHRAGDDWRADWLLYTRGLRSSALASNVNPGYGSTSPTTGAVDLLQATNDQSLIDQSAFGTTLQLSTRATLAGLRHEASLGLAADGSNTGYVQQAQDAAFNADRSVSALGPYATTVDAATRTRGLGAYALDRIALGEALTLSIAARYDRSAVQVRDRSGSAPGLDGDHRYARFNPSLGLTWQPQEQITLYANRSDGMRAPTAIELTCADPQAPCKLPNNFLSDPPLKPVVARSWELGARGRYGAGGDWSVALFRTRLADDIQFVSAPQASLNAGYFRNVGDTLRQGLELSLAWKAQRWQATARYSFVDARFENGYVAHSPDNASADAAGNIVVQPGNRIASVPRHTLKLSLQADVSAQWQLSGDAVLRSGATARGNENEGDPRGVTAGYALLNLSASYQPAVAWEWRLQIDNVFDRRAASFALLGQNQFTGPGRSFSPATAQAEPFFGLVAPRGVWLSVRYRLL